MSGPTEFEPDLLFEAIVQAIGAATSLRVLDQLLNDGSTPSSLLHRSVRIDPSQMDSTGMRARPGDVLGLRERVQIVMTHDYSPNAHRASYQLAGSDLRALLRAVLTRTEISGLASPLFAGRTIRQVGHRIEQVVSFTFSYEIGLPEAAGPGVP